MDWPATPLELVSFRKWFSWALILLLIFLVMTALGWQHSLSDTESWALYIAGQPFSVQLSEIRADLVHPPLIYLIQRGWLAATGGSDTAARFLPVVIATPAIFLLVLLATRVSPHWRLLSFFLACVYFQIGAPPVQVRMYGLAMLLTIAGLLLWDMWRENPRTSLLAAWTAIMTLLIYTHLFGALVVMSFVLLNWLLGPRKWAFTVAAGIPALAFLPWFLYVLPVYGTRGLEPNLSWVHQSMLSAIPAFFSNFLGAFNTTNYRLRVLIILASSAIHLALLVLLWWNRARFWPPRRDADATQRWFWSALVLAGVPLLILLTFSIVKNGAFEARFVLGASIAYSIFLFLSCQLSGRAGRIVLLCVLLPWRIAVAVNSVFHYAEPELARQSVEFIAGQVRPGDLLLVDGPPFGNIVYWDWTRHFHRSERVATLAPDPPGHYLAAIIDPVPIARMDLNGVSRIWFIQRQPRKRPDVAEALAARGFLPAPRDDSRPGTPLLFERKDPT